MKLLIALLLGGCTMTLTPTGNKVWQCQHQTCPRVAAHEEAGPDDSTYDDNDDTCICRFKDGRIYTTPRK